MWIDLPAIWLAVLNVAAIPSIHLGVSWFFTRLPRAWFRPGSFPFRMGQWEEDGTFYDRVFAVRSWKGRLPDAAPWFDGFPKGKLRARDESYLRTFQAETCRGEAAHYVQIPALLTTLIWNPWPTAASIMIVYAFLSNLPCIIIQRHTRHRIGHLLPAFSARPRHSAVPCDEAPGPRSDPR